jgi:hypothetical protein
MNIMHLSLQTSKITLKLSSPAASDILWRKVVTENQIYATKIISIENDYCMRQARQAKLKLELNR